MYGPVIERLSGKRVVFALTGSYCTLEKAVTAMQHLHDLGCRIIPVVSYNVRDHGSRFGEAAYWKTRILEASGAEMIIDTIAGAEPIGPQNLADLLLIAPCSGNTLAKLANGITDTPVLMAAKAHLRNSKPLVISISTNDGLGMNMKNIGLLLNAKNIYFVPFGQDDFKKKPNSLVAHTELLLPTLEAALEHEQYQPLLHSYE